MKKQTKEKLLTFIFYSAEGMSSFSFLLKPSALVNPSGRLLTGSPTPDITIIFWPACRALGILTIFYAVPCLDLKGRGHKIEFKYFCEIGTSLLGLTFWSCFFAELLQLSFSVLLSWKHFGPIGSMLFTVFHSPSICEKRCKHLWKPRAVFFIFTLLNFH